VGWGSIDASRHRAETDEQRARVSELKKRLDEAVDTDEKLRRLEDLVAYVRTLPPAPHSD
jgi:hypothetical protein